ncbi:MAG: class I SAM-dependent methyltransferase [Clostridia bacterium]|jgi:2-polyprenyl-3-methyl-5-hydroxy-6-metoxy-1,4-benzoquinol methylase|nr:class I SAM-dependent methyltransferase [Clostridia bacterium]
MYTALGKVYDLFYPDDTQRRADAYAAVLPSGEGVDIGCGTGALTLALHARGYRVYGVDPSPDMLNAAQARATNAGVNVRFVQASAQDVLAAHPLDFALAANDVFNYVPRLDKALRSVYKALKAGGVFAFDISSAYKLTEVLAGNTFTQTENDVTYIWQNFRRGKRLIIDFTVFSPQGETYIKTCETQVQYIRSREEVTDALAAAGFINIRAYAFGTKRAPAADTQRILFTAQKERRT